MNERTGGPWWSRRGWAPHSDQCSIDSSLIEHALAESAFGGGAPIRWIEASGMTAGGVDQTAGAFESLGGKLAIRREDVALVVWPQALAEVCVSERKFATIRAACADPTLEKEIRRVLDGLIEPGESKGVVHVVLRSSFGGGYELNGVDVAAVPLERGNYTEEVLRAFDHVAEDLASDAPCGRITILRGAPGTGKSFLVRALLHSVSARFVFVPPQLIQDLEGPDLLGALMSTSSRRVRGPIVLIVEDADDCLVPRQNDNMAAISALLNLGDGILGSILDIRIIASSNADRVDIDSAILRAGRLCRQIDVDPLDEAGATRVFERLLAARNITPPARRAGLLEGKRRITLAEVYRLARDSGWRPG